jgi:hypothetical protein
MAAALAVGSAGQGSGVVDKLGDGSFTATSLLSPVLRAAAVARPLPRPALASSQPVAARTGHSAGAPLPHILSLSPLILTLSLCFSSLQAADQRRPPKGVQSRCRRGHRHEQRCASLAAGVRAQPRRHGRGRRAADTDKGASTWPARGQRRSSAQGRKAVDARTPGEEQGRMVAGPCLLTWNHQFGWRGATFAKTTLTWRHVCENHLKIHRGG